MPWIRFKKVLLEVFYVVAFKLLGHYALNSSKTIFEVLDTIEAAEKVDSRL